MLDINKKSYTHKYVVGGSGVFTDINNMYNQAKSSDFFRTLSGMKTMLTNHFNKK